MPNQNLRKKEIAAGAFLEMVRKNVSMLSKVPLVLAIPITILLALGVTISPIMFGIFLGVLPILLGGTALIALVNFLTNLYNTEKRSENNLIQTFENDLENKKEHLKKLKSDVDELLVNAKISEEKRKQIAHIISKLNKEPKQIQEPSFIKKQLQKIPMYLDLFFKYFVIIPGSIGALGGLIFLLSMTLGINVFQMGTIVMFMSLTGVGGLAAAGIVIGISILAMIALFVYKAKFEEKISAKHKQIDEEELRLTNENKDIDKEIERWTKLKNKIKKPKEQVLEQVASSDMIVNVNGKIEPKYYDQKKSRSFIVSGAILSGINEAIFMFAKYVTFTGLCVAVLAGLGVAMSPAFFIGLTAVLIVFTLIMAGIGVSKFLGAVKNVNNLAEDPVLHYLRTQVKIQPAQGDLVPDKKTGMQQYFDFINMLEQYPGILGVIIKKLAIKKIIEKIADNIPFIKRHFTIIETICRYTFIFAISLSALTSATILGAGIAGISITGLGAILAAALLSGGAIPVVAIAVIGLTLLIGFTVSYYKKHYENPLAKAQRDARKEKAELVELKLQGERKSQVNANQESVVRAPVRHNKASTSPTFGERTNQPVIPKNTQ